MLGISFDSNPEHRLGIGDQIQFTSLPENYYLTTGKKLPVLTHSWIFDHNPYVDRTTKRSECTKIINIWENFIQKKFPETPNDVYTSNADFWAKMLECDTHLNRPRLYYPAHPGFYNLLHAQGRSQGIMPDHVTQKILSKNDPHLKEIGARRLHPAVPFIENALMNYWNLVEIICRCDTLYTMCSGPAWIAACFPYIKIKSVLSHTNNTNRKLELQTPLHKGDLDSIFRDTTLFEYYNTTEKDLGFAKTYLSI